VFSFSLIKISGSWHTWSRRRGKNYDAACFAGVVAMREGGFKKARSLRHTTRTFGTSLMAVHVAARSVRNTHPYLRRHHAGRAEQVGVHSQISCISISTACGPPPYVVFRAHWNSGNSLRRFERQTRAAPVAASPAGFSS
jgi:hypothetical protein